jgi:hypothetical protein
MLVMDVKDDYPDGLRFTSRRHDVKKLPWPGETITTLPGEGAPLDGSNP